jgi:rfaE bifunctional protein nucleotidyltransferase chain/domain
MKNELLEFKKNSSNQKVVFTNGCFDILHRGHLTYLKEAKACGDLLVVGVNSDRSVRELKGPERPINNEQDRKFMLENLKSVDFVAIFDEETPIELIKELMPDTLVKGGDWAVDQIVGSKEVIQNGGEVLSLNFVDGFSTTNIIEKIKK